MKTNTSKKRNFYTQGQRFAARILFILWLLASVSPEGVLAGPQGQPANKTSPQGFFGLLVTSGLLFSSGSPKGAPQCQAPKGSGDPSPPECPVILYRPEVTLGLETLTKEGQQLMQDLAYLDPGFIPLSLVRVVLKEDDSDQLSEVVSNLSILSLVQMVSNTERQEGLQVTTKGQEYFQGWRPEAALGTRETILLQLARVLEAQMPWVEPTPDEGWQKARLYAPHVEKVVTALEESKVAPSAVVAKLLGCMGQYSKKVQVDNRGAVKFFQRALAIYEQVYKEDLNDLEIAKILYNLGLASRALGDARKAAGYYERVLKIRKQVYHETPNHPEIANTLNNLGSVYHALGDGGQAVSFLRRALKMKREVYHETPNHPEIASTLNNLGSAWGDLGDVRKAKRYFNRALAILQQVYQQMPSQPAIAGTLYNLGNAWSALGDMDKAVSSYERALEIFEQVDGKNHWQVSINLAMAHRALKARKIQSTNGSVPLSP